MEGYLSWQKTVMKKITFFLSLIKVVLEKFFQGAPEFSYLGTLLNHVNTINNEIQSH